MTLRTCAFDSPECTDWAPPDSDARCPGDYRHGSSRYYCTRIDGHAGSHEAGLLSGVYIASWDDDDDGAR